MHPPPLSGAVPHGTDPLSSWVPLPSPRYLAFIISMRILGNLSVLNSPGPAATWPSSTAWGSLSYLGFLKSRGSSAIWPPQHPMDPQLPGPPQHPGILSHLALLLNSLGILSYLASSTPPRIPSNLVSYQGFLTRLNSFYVVLLSYMGLFSCWASP